MWLWLFIIIVLTIIEISTISLTTIWFVMSAIISLICSIFIKSFYIQFAIFVIVGILLLISTRKYLVKLMNKKKEDTNIDRIIGMSGIVTEKITKSKPGCVKVDGKYWTSIADKTIDVDKTVKVLLIDSTKIKVEEES